MEGVNVAIKIILVAVVLFIGIEFFPAIYHWWWINTHCTLVLGTEVCQ